MNRKQKLALLEDWYSREMTRLYNYIVFRVTYEEEADDIVAVVCDRSLKRLHQYDPKRGSFSAWMFGIARNVMNDYFRDLARQADDVSLESLPAVQGRGDSPEERLIQAERFQQVILLFEHLSENEREVLGLRYGSDLKYQEIAEVMGISSDNVGVLLHRALGKLRDALNEREAKHELRTVSDF